MDVTVTARRTDVRPQFRERAVARLARIEKLDGSVQRVGVEVSTEHNPRQADRRERVGLTVVARGPAIRAEAAAPDRFTAFDVALDKLEEQLRRAAERRKDRHHAGVKLGDIPPEQLASDAELPALRLGADGETLGDGDGDGDGDASRG